MLVPDALFDHIPQISSDAEITGSLVQFAQFRQLMSRAMMERPPIPVTVRSYESGELSMLSRRVAATWTIGRLPSSSAGLAQGDPVAGAIAAMAAKGRQ